jgi:hypothetical protein
LQSSCESGGRAGYDGAKRRRGSKVHMAVDTLGQLLALRVTPADEDDRAQVGEVVQAVQALTGAKVELAYVDQGYTGEAAAPLAGWRGFGAWRAITSGCPPPWPGCTLSPSLACCWLASPCIFRLVSS